LQSSLPTQKEQTDFLDILFTEYTPERMQKLVSGQQQQQSYVLLNDHEGYHNPPNLIV